GARGERDQHVRTFATTTAELLALRDWLGAHGVTHVAIESTGVYWKPIFHVLERDPAATNLDLLRALRPGGGLAIIDFPPMFSWRWPWSPKDAPADRTGHGVAAGLVVEEVTAGGFTLVKVIEDWPGRGPLKSYCAIFRKPEAGS